MWATVSEKSATALEWAKVNGSAALEWARVNGSDAYAVAKKYGGQAYEWAEENGGATVSYLASIDYKGHYERTYARVSKVATHYLAVFMDTYELVEGKFAKYWPDFRRVVRNRFVQAVDAADHYLEHNETWKELTVAAQPHFLEVLEAFPSLREYGTEQELLKKGLLGLIGLIFLTTLYLFIRVCLCPRSKVSKAGSVIKKQKSKKKTRKTTQVAA